MPQPIQHTYGQMDVAYAKRVLALPPQADGQVWMVNLMAYRKKAVYDGVESEIGGKEADDRYNPVDVLVKIGAQLAFAGDVVEQDSASQPRWDRIGIVRYPTRRSFIDMGEREDFREKHKHKQAGMDQTIVCPSLPLAGVMAELDALTPAAAADDTAGESIVSLHTIRFRDGAEDRKAAYPLAIGKVALAHGARVEAMLEVEGTFLGDGREWDQTFMFRFPSPGACTAAIAEMTDGALGEAVADRYDVATRPFIDAMRASIDTV